MKFKEVFNMEKLLNASRVVSDATSVTKVDSSVNLIHMVNAIARVYGRTAKSFLGMRPEDVEKQAISMAGDEKLLAMFAKGNKVSDCDVVSLIEALKWTGIVMTTNQKPRIYLALVEPSEERGKNIEMATKQSNVWNTFLVEGYQGTEYTEYGLLPQTNVKSLNILSKSLDSYDVLLGKGSSSNEN